jgi:hypothetical protein
MKVFGSGMQPIWHIGTHLKLPPYFTKGFINFGRIDNLNKPLDQSLVMGEERCESCLLDENV